jgi:Domain of unknown function (DUF4604)
MAPKEPTKHQLSARLSYSQHTPAFLRKFQSRVSGLPDDDSDGDPEFGDDGSGRPPIPRRPPIPERPASNPGSEDEDRDDEAPQVVVLKEGKHLSAREVENEKRKGEVFCLVFPQNSSIYLSVFHTIKRRVCPHSLTLRWRHRRRVIRKTLKRRSRRLRKSRASPFLLVRLRLPRPDQRHPSGRPLVMAVLKGMPGLRHQNRREKRRSPKWGSRLPTKREQDACSSVMR